MSKSCDEQPPWYAAGLAFHCTQCGDCCSGPPGFVWVDASEIEQLAAAMNYDDVNEFEKKFVRQVGIRKSLIEYSDGDCIFLDEKTRRCLVYEARPVQCRTWPFWTENLKTPEAWEKTCQVCPGCNRGKVYTLDEIERRLGKAKG